MTFKRFNWNFSAKDIAYLLIIGTIGFFGYRFYKELRAEVQQSSIAYKQLSESLARAQNELVTRAELKTFIKTTGIDLAKIKKDLKNVGADLVAVGVTVATIKGKIDTNQESNSTSPHDPPNQPSTCQLCDIYGYTGSIQIKDISLGKMPFGKIEFDASKDKPWTTTHDQIDVEVVTVRGASDKEDIDVFYHEISLLNKSRPELLGKKYKLSVVSSEFKQTLSKSKEFYWWAPHLDLGTSNLVSFPDYTGEHSLGVTLGFSVAAFGRTTNDNDWRFIHLSVGVDTKENWFIQFDPVQYNIGRVIPIISDLFLGIGPVYNGHWGLGISLGTTL